MSIGYFAANKSIAIIPQEETGRRRSFVFGTPAYDIALKAIKEGNDVEDKLRFFTQWGKKVQLGGITIESTPTDSFNITMPDGKLVSTYPSAYMRILDAVLKNNEASCASEIHKMLQDAVSYQKIKKYFPMVELVREGNNNKFVVKGKYGVWSVDKETLTCQLNGQFACIVCHGTYKNNEFSEKEQLLMSKLVACANDEMFYKMDNVIKNQVDRIVHNK